MSGAPASRIVPRRPAPKCLACGRAITKDDAVVAVAGEELHARCALYQARGSH